MPHTMVQHMFNSASGMPEDAIVNTWHFNSSETADETDGEIIANIVNKFYDTVTSPAAAAVMNYLATTGMAIPRHRNKVYDMSQTPPRIPVYDATAITGASNAAQQLPTEVAVCLSFNAAPLPGVDAARRRGRVYVGPLNTNALTAGTGTVGTTVSFSMSQALCESGNRLRLEAAAAGHVWCVYSRTAQAGGATIDQYLSTVVSVWSDDAFDTVRSRGRKAGSRLVRP